MKGAITEPAPPASGAAHWIQNFFPGYFALVMATGIVSLAWHFQGGTAIAQGLFWINVPAYLLLWVITALRWRRFRADVIDDLTSHARGATFLTMVAATCVLGKQFATLTGLMVVGKWLWIAALLLWLLVIYTFFTALTVREPKPKLESGINGSWLLAVVATESLCTLGTMVADQFAHTALVIFMSLMAYLLGAMFYLILITMIVYRWFFRSMRANMLTPPYWINMGALAITTLAGARLWNSLNAVPELGPFKPFVVGFTLFFWSTATWWIPLLLTVGAWRHCWQKVPLTYDPQYWSLVFPLGMYSVATFVFADVAKLPFLRPLPLVFAIAALLAWLITAAGLVRHVVTSRNARPPAP